MKKTGRFAVFCLIFLLAALLFPTQAFANSAEPPGLTVLVSNAPDDLEIAIRFPDGRELNALEVSSSAWETYFRFFQSEYPDHISGGQITLVARYGGKSTECALPREMLESYNNAAVFDLQTGSIRPPYAFRPAVIIAARVALTLIIEGVIFYLFGYRERKSWTLFLIFNLITQGLLNCALQVNGYYSFWFLALLVLEFFVLLTELLLFSYVKEHTPIRTRCYVLSANLASLVLGGALIIYLPIFL